MNLKVEIFQNTVQATMQTNVNNFLATKDPKLIKDTISVAFLRGALTHYVVYIYYLG